MFDENPTATIQNSDTPPAPGAELVASALTYSDTLWSDGDTITVRWTVTNTSDQATEMATQAFYLSNNSLISTGDKQISTFVQPYLAPGQSAEIELEITLDFALLDLVPGLLFVGPYVTVNEVVEFRDDIWETPTTNLPYVLISEDGTNPLDNAQTFIAGYSSTEFSGVLSSSNTIDVYSFTPTKTDVVAYEIWVTENGGNTDFILLDSSGKVVSASFGPQDFDTMILNRDLGETYYLIVKSDGQSETPYGLTVESVEIAWPPGGSAYDLTISSTILSTDSKVIAEWMVENGGDSYAVVPTSLYLSTDANITIEDTVIFTETNAWGLDQGEAGYRGPSGWDREPYALLADMDLPEGVYYLGAIAYPRLLDPGVSSHYNISNVVQIIVADRAQVLGTDEGEFVFGTDSSDEIDAGLGWLDVIYTGEGYDAIVFNPVFTDRIVEPFHFSLVMDFDPESDVIQFSGEELITHDLQNGVLILGEKNGWTRFDYMVFLADPDLTSDDIIFDLV